MYLTAISAILRLVESSFNSRILMRRFAFYFFVGSLAFSAGIFFFQLLSNQGPKPEAVQVKVDEPTRTVSDIEDKILAQGARNSPKETNAKFICNDKAILAVLADIKRNKVLREWFEPDRRPDQITDCREMFDVEKKDLNRDGIVEFVVLGIRTGLCSARSDCPAWVVRQKAGKYQIILGAGRVQDISDDKTYHQGYKDIATSRTSGGCCYRTAEYRYKKGSYKAFRCTEWGWSETGYDKDRSLKPEECRAW